jgi:hypothetical protein
MLVLRLQDGDTPPVMGTGYYLKLGLNESIEWAAPPDGPFGVIASQVDAQRDEIYRITHQLALSVDGSTAAVGRSGESKEADSLATRVMLVSYGLDVKEAIEETFEIVSDGRGDTETTFSVEGMDDFETAAPIDLVTMTAEADLLNIPSTTLKKELYTRVASALVPDVDEKTKQTIKDEIREGVDQATELKDELKAAEHEAKAADHAATATERAAAARGELTPHEQATQAAQEALAAAKQSQAA